MKTKIRFTVFSNQFGNEPCDSLAEAEALYAERCRTEGEVSLYDWSKANDTVGESYARLKEFVRPSTSKEGE